MNRDNQNCALPSNSFHNNPHYLDLFKGKNTKLFNLILLYSSNQTDIFHIFYFGDIGLCRYITGTLKQSDNIHQVKQVKW